MNLPPKRIDILKLLRRYFVLRTAQIRHKVIPHDKDASITRAHLRKLVLAELIRRYQPKIVDPLGTGSAPPVFTITVKGASVLAAITGDASYLLTAEVSFSNWMVVNHWCSLSSLGMVIDDAFARQNYARLVSLHFEHEVVDPGANKPSEKYFLHTTVGEKCFFIPDMAFETDVKGHRRAWMAEYETGSDTPARVAAKKHKGIAGFAAGNHLAKMFPAARDFRVIFFCPNAAWRDALRQEFEGKSGGEFTLFCSTLDVKPETLLHEPKLLYMVEKGPFPFLPRSPEGAPVVEKDAETGAERV